MARKKRVKSAKTTENRDKSRNYIRKVRKAFQAAEPWIPWIIAGIYSISMAVLAFRYHTVGGLDVETDFYAELYPQARKIIEGQFSPLNYGAKGPVYSFLLAVMYFPARDFFTAAQILNLFGSAVFLAVLYHLVRIVFNRITSLIVVFIIISNYMFQNFTYQVSSDMPFMAFCVLSMFFLFRNGGTRDIVFSAMFGILAFLTRYNGVFIAFGSVLFLAFEHISGWERIRKIGLWIGIFLVAGLPWFIPNWVATGNPVHNDNYINVMLEFYGRGEHGLRYESWTDALPKQFTGMGDIFFYDPVYFLKKVAANVKGHFFWDMRALVQWRLGIFVMLGIPAFFFLKPGRRMLLYFSFGIMYFLILTLVFYNARFSLYLLLFYVPLAVLPFTSERVVRRLGRFSWVPVAVIVLLTCSYTYTSTVAMLDNIKYTPFFLKEMGLALHKYEPDRSSKLLARKPHAAYYADMVPSMFPDDVQNIEELVTHCRKYDIEYVLYSLVEMKYRPQLQELLNINKKHHGLENIFTSMYGVIYHVKDD